MPKRTFKDIYAERLIREEDEALIRDWLSRLRATPTVGEKVGLLVKLVREQADYPNIVREVVRRGNHWKALELARGRMLRGGNPLPAGDQVFLRHAMRQFRIPKLRVRDSESHRRWPDIWIQLGEVPVITVTREWARQPVHERRKRLTHELLHLRGYHHGPMARELFYSTYPAEDTFSRAVYRSLVEQ